MDSADDRTALPVPARAAGRVPAGTDRCPCGSGDSISACCGPFLAGERLAPTAVQLMRSRYAAYALGDAAHLLRTWDPSTRPSAAELAHSLGAGLVWTRLVVHATEAGGPFEDAGTAEFTALARDADGARVRMRETSRFVRRDGAWLYVDGDVTG
ncbi:YchJ family protein [Brachybacterium huguangmaarense]